MTESAVQALDNFEQHAGFSTRERLALRYADSLIYNPGGDLDSLYADLRREFSAPELEELGTLIGLNCGFIGHLVHSWHL